MNSHSVEIAVRTLVTLFVLMDPVGIVPIFIALTKGQSIQQQEYAARHISFVVVLVLITSTIFGNDILDYFYIGVAEFKVSGGLLLLLMSIQMLMSENTSSAFLHSSQTCHGNGKLITPLGIPLLAGPGAIGTVIIYGHKAHDIVSYGFILFDVVIASLIAYITMRNAHHLAHFFGEIGIEILTKISGLILGAIAIRFICQGLVSLLPGLG